MRRSRYFRRPIATRCTCARRTRRFASGRPPRARSYLNIPNIISTALITAATRSIPGYGFLAENARFAEICADHGLDVHRTAAERHRRHGRQSDGQARSCAKPASRRLRAPTFWPRVDDAAAQAAEAIGYPVLLKATAGGGGKGMRVVRACPQNSSARYASATAEAEASFKDGRVYMEKLISNPRHIEVQVLGDAFGNVVHLGERDCSVQKPSHQKIIEETPAPNLSARARSALHEMARARMRSTSATPTPARSSFSRAGDDVYFMEMNTRIQVEHPVTEMVYGIDLVKEQIRIAAGRAARIRADATSCARGHAIECRINAEDPRNNFAPQAGTVSNVVFPGGPGHPRRHAPVRRRDDPAVLRLDDREDRRATAIRATSAIARMERALARNGRRRRAHDDRAVPGDLGVAAVSRGPLRRRVPSRLIAAVRPSLAMPSRRLGRERRSSAVFGRGRTTASRATR